MTARYGDGTWEDPMPSGPECPECLHPVHEAGRCPDREPVGFDVDGTPTGSIRCDCDFEKEVD
jgi:hypothetical protein